MHLKQKIYCLSVLFYIIATGLPSVVWGKPSVSPSRSSLHNDGNRVTVPRGGLALPSNRGRQTRLHLDSTQGGRGSSLLNFDHLQKRAQAEASRAKMASTTETETGFINRDRWRQTEEKRVFIAPSPPGEVCGIGGVKPVVQGKFYVIGQLGPTTDYQADSASSGMSVWGTMNPPARSSSSLLYMVGSQEFLCRLRSICSLVKMLNTQLSCLPTLAHLRLQKKKTQNTLTVRLLKTKLVNFNCSIPLFLCFLSDSH